MANFFEKYLTTDPVDIEKEKTTGNFFDKYLTGGSSVDPSEPMLLEAGTYTQDDLVENDEAYSIVEGFMRDRYGDESIEEKSRESVVDSFLNNRRGVVSGNSVRGLSEMDYINDIKDDEAKRVRAAQAYQLYENMAGIFSRETSVAEKAEGIMDFGRSVVFDPVNLIGGLFGKAVANGSLRVGTSAAQRAALEAMKKEGTKEAAKKVGAKVFSDGLKTARAASKAKVNAYAQNVLGKSAAQRLATKAAITEILAVTAVDGVVGVGMEYIYQEGLVDVEAQEDISWASVGIAALGGLILGTGQAALIARRGVSDTAIPTALLPEPEAKGFLSEVSQTIAAYMKQDKVKIGRDWKTKIEGGATLSKDSKDFGSEFVQNLLFGYADEEGNVILKGMSQVAYERGFVWSKRFEGDKFSNWMSDLISEVSDKEAQGLLRAIEKATGNKIKVRGDDGKIIPRSKVTGRDIGDIFAYKLSEAGSTLGAAGRSAKQLGMSISDKELKDLYDSAIDGGFVKSDKKKPKEASKFTEGTAKTQNRLIRMLVAHPSTSALNVIGWGANTALQSVSDVGVSLIYAGKGTLQKLIGDMEAGANSQRIARALIETNAQRIKFLLDPDMTYTAFESALQRNSEALEKLNSVLPGGIEGTNKLLTDGKFSADQKLIGLAIDDKIDLIQKLTLVQAQDAFTKSQEFLFQMDKKLRIATGKGWNDFYRSENIGDMSLKQFIASKEYRAIEASAVDDTIEAIFSKTYKTKDGIGLVAGMLEDARNVPGLGMAVPFGRFFNNTVGFLGKNTPGVNIILKRAGFYDNMSYEEAISRSLVSAGVVYTLALQEVENIKQGLPMYAGQDRMVPFTDPLTGETVSQQYDFPVSAYKGAARILALTMMGDHQQAMKAFGQFTQDFGLSGLLRNLDKTQRDTLEAIKFMADPERRDVVKAVEIVTNTLATQYANPLIRPLEPLNVLAGIARDEDAAPIDRAQNNKLVNNAFRYIDNILPMFMGELAEPRETAAGGTADMQSTKVLGARVIRLTDTQRVMNSIGLRPFDLDTDAKIRDQAPQAANRLNGILFDIIESESSLLLESGWWKKLTPREKLDHWKTVVRKSEDLAKTFLRMQYSGPEEVISLQYDITSKFAKKDIQKAVKELNLGDVEDLEQGELFILEQYLKTEQTLSDLSRMQKMAQ